MKRTISIFSLLLSTSLAFATGCGAADGPMEPDEALLERHGALLEPDEHTNLFGDHLEFASRTILSPERIRALAEEAGVDPRRVTYVDLVPFDEDGDGDFLLVGGVTEVLPDGALLETYIDPSTGEVLAQEAPHEGLFARILDLGAHHDPRLEPQAAVPSGSSPDTYESFPWGWQLPYINSNGAMTQGYNRGTHTGSIYYSTDWDPGNCGHPVYAPSSGWVMDNANRGGWGNQLVVSGACAGSCSSNGWGYRYLWRLAHFQSTPVVKPGWWIEKNRHVGYMGTTGNSSACHIHFTAYRGSYQGSGNISGESMPINRWPGSGDSICGGRLAGYNFFDSSMDWIRTGGTGCP